MSKIPQLVEFVLLPMFERAAKGLLDDEGLHELQTALLRDPEAGDLMAGTGGVRKVRFAIGSRGKSAGVRVIYYYRNAAGRIYLITVYTKANQDNLTSEQKNQMRQLTALLAREP